MPSYDAFISSNHGSDAGLSATVERLEPLARSRTRPVDSGSPPRRPRTGFGAFGARPRSRRCPG